MRSQTLRHSNTKMLQVNEVKTQWKVTFVQLDDKKIIILIPKKGGKKENRNQYIVQLEPLGQRSIALLKSDFFPGIDSPFRIFYCQ